MKRAKKIESLFKISLNALSASFVRPFKKFAQFQFCPALNWFDLKALPETSCSSISSTDILSSFWKKLSTIWKRQILRLNSIFGEQNNIEIHKAPCRVRQIIAFCFTTVSPNIFNFHTNSICTLGFLSKVSCHLCWYVLSFLSKTPCRLYWCVFSFLDNDVFVFAFLFSVSVTVFLRWPFQWYKLFSVKINSPCF